MGIHRSAIRRRRRTDAAETKAEIVGSQDAPVSGGALLSSLTAAEQLLATLDAETP